MIPYNPFSMTSIWHRSWRLHVQNAKTIPEQAEGYCRAAMIAQSEYIQYLAIQLAKENTNG